MIKIIFIFIIIIIIIYYHYYFYYYYYHYYYYIYIYISSLMSIHGNLNRIEWVYQNSGFDCFQSHV